MRSTLFSFLFIISLSAFSNSNQDIDSMFTEGKLVDSFINQQFTSYDEIPIPLDSNITLSDRTVQMYDSSLTSFYKFKIIEFNRANKVLKWQYTSGKIIFWVVLFIVMSGLILSGIQFYYSSKSNFQQPYSEIKVGYSGIRLHTSVLGLLILIVSIAFFYLYLKHVYPVSIL